MDRSNSISSNSSDGSRASSYDPFPYQTRLLERTSSLRSTGSLSRSNSQTASNSHGGAPPTTRRWTPTHRIGTSLDVVRGKWEERVRAETLSDIQVATHLPKDPLSTAQASSASVSSSHAHPSSSATESRPATPPVHSTNASGNNKTPPHLKRRTMPAPIIASPLSPNTTGITIHNPTHSSTTSTPNRIHLPSPGLFQSASFTAAKTPSGLSFPSSQTLSEKPRSSPPSRYRRANTVDGTVSPFVEAPESSDANSFSSKFSAIPSRTTYTPPSSASSNHRRPTSLYGNHRFSSPSLDKFENVELSRASTSSSASDSSEPSPTAHYTVTSPPSSAMSPNMYKSSYMANKNKKASMYGDQLSAGRRLGRHLPRIASGDGDEDWERKQAEDSQTLVERRPRQMRDLDEVHVFPEPSRAKERALPAVPNADDVVGVPGRIRLSRDKALSTPTSPLPSARLTKGGLWADTQRHLLLAYEYLCHVGEAQQWIEGCLGEELGFGVVELEQGLRNGVVLAKLVRKFQGPGVVRKIYEVCSISFLIISQFNGCCRIAGPEARLPPFGQYQLLL